MSVAAVVVNWNGRQDTLACLDSVCRSRPERPTVILVDNGSTDGSVAAVRRAFPLVEIICLPKNLHFARGANAGLERGITSGAEFLWLLNNDTLVSPDALAEMLRIANADARIGVVGSKLIHPRNPPGVIVGANCDFSTGAIIEPAPPDDETADRMFVDYVWGCSMLVKAELLRQIGLFDAGFCAYFEDTDFCLRARQHDWLTATALRAIIHHAGSRSADQAFLSQMWLRGRNWLRCYRRHAPLAKRAKLSVWMLGYRLPRLAWISAVTIGARKLRPRGRNIRLWHRDG